MHRSQPGSSGATVQAGPSITPNLLQTLDVRPIPFTVAKSLLLRYHYLRSMPGGTRLSFGVFAGLRLVGALTIGCGPAQAHRLVEGASVSDCATLTRLWLDEALPTSSASRTIGILLRSLRCHTALRFLVSYADPAHGHAGTVYQATNWLYTGLSQGTPQIDLGDGVVRHSRSVAQVLGSHSTRYLRSQGITARLVHQSRKHRYVTFLDPKWRNRLTVPVLPYPKQEDFGACPVE